MASRFLNTIERHLLSLAEPRFLLGASLFRVVTGSTLLLLYLINYAQRRFLYGPAGLYPHDLSAIEAPWSLYSWSSDMAWFELVFHAALVVNVCWLLGVKTWLLTPLQAWFTFSLQRRAPGVFDGGDNLISIVLVYMCFADVSHHFALLPSTRRSDWVGRVCGLFHNAAIVATALQLCIVYCVAGLSKIMGTQWPGGVALYYALRLGEFYRPGVSEWVYRSDILVALASYAIVAFQVCFPLLFFLNRNARVVALLLSIGFHLGIALTMGLVSFAMFLIAVDLTFVGEREHALLVRLRATWPRRPRAAPGNLRGAIAAE